MKKLIITLCIGAGLLLCNSCGTTTNENGDSTEGSAVDSTGVEEQESEGLTLGEKSFGAVVLPFWQNGTKAELEDILTDCSVTEEMAVAEGGEFKVYHLHKANEHIADFEMSMDDSTYLYQLVLRSGNISDQYGLRIGDAYTKIRELRPDAPIAKMGYHFSTYVRIPGSSIVYEVKGDYTPPSDLTLENVKDHQYTEDDLKDFKITSIFWENTTPAE